MIETGETFLNDAQLLRFIQEKCGDEIAYHLERRFTEKLTLPQIELVKKAIGFLDMIDWSDLEEYLTDVQAILNKVVEEGK